MENEVENTVEEVQEDNNAIKQMRERIKELETVEKEYKSVQMANAIKDAGFDPETGAGKALKDLYKGELQADAIKQFASDYGWGETPAAPTQAELPRLQELQARGGVEEPEEFTLEQFTEAAVFQSPEELEQIKLLEAEEATRFTPLTGAARRGRRVQGLVQE